MVREGCRPCNPYEFPRHLCNGRNRDAGKGVVRVDRVEEKEASSQERTLPDPQPTHPGQQRLALSHVVNEAQGPGGAVEARVQTVVQVGQALPLLLSAVRGLQLRAAGVEGGEAKVNQRLAWLACLPSA